MIEVEGLTKRFGHITAVDNINFSVEKGEVVGFLGPNGAGKTTTMRILTCFLPADEGTARIAGHDVFTDSIDVRNKVGYLPEDAPLYLDMEVTEFLDYVASLRGIKPDKRKGSIEKMIEVCGLKPVLKMNIGELSRGFKQRVGLAQAMIHDPEILMLDEPTSGLDPNQIIGIRSLIKELGKEKTVILSTHILSEVEATCGRSIIIDRGKIVADGSLADMSKRVKAGDAHRIKVRGDRAAIEEKLQSLAPVKEIIYKGEESGIHQFELFSTHGENLCEDIFHMAASSGFSLAELYMEKTTLEHIFTQLTKGE
jgi:ABC-2 type transport system ATP-binding protein